MYENYRRYPVNRGSRHHDCPMPIVSGRGAGSFPEFIGDESALRRPCLDNKSMSRGIGALSQKCSFLIYNVYCLVICISLIKIVFDLYILIFLMCSCGKWNQVYDNKCRRSNVRFSNVIENNLFLILYCKTMFRKCCKIRI